MLIIRAAFLHWTLVFWLYTWLCKIQSLIIIRDMLVLTLIDSIYSSHYWDVFLGIHWQRMISSPGIILSIRPLLPRQCQEKRLYLSLKWCKIPGLRKSLVPRGDVFPNTPLLLTVYGYIYILFGQIVLSVNLLSAIYCCNISLKVATVQREHWTMYAWNIWQVLGIPHFCNFFIPPCFGCCFLIGMAYLVLGWHTWCLEHLGWWICWDEIWIGMMIWKMFLVISRGFVFIFSE